MKKLLTTLCGAAFCAATFAADHIDAPTATGDPLADLNDFYAFVNPNDPSEVILAITMHPFADNETLFSSAIEYQFYSDNMAGGSAAIRCSVNASQEISCSGPDGRAVSGPVGETSTNGDFRVYAGLRDDPFFFDFEAFGETIANAEPRFTDPGVDFFAGLNVLSIVVGISADALSSGEGDGRFVQQMWVATERTFNSGIQGGITGSWINPATPGQGWILEGVAPPDVGSKDISQLVMYFFGYNSGAREWLVSTGSEFNGNTASLGVARVSGDAFGADLDPDSVELTDVGTMVFDFDTCTSGTVSFTSTADDLLDFFLPIERLSAIDGLDCNLFASGQIDRNGRAAINSALIAADRKDAYNFASDPSQWPDMFLEDIIGGLTFTDSLDGIEGNLLTGDPVLLGTVVVDDRLQTAVNQADCGSYLAVESAGVFGTPLTECGGRTLEADVIDVTLTVAVSGGEIPVGDGVFENDVAFLDNFPFLAPPHN